MEARLHILASGSSGNAIFVSVGDTRLLVDAGVSLRYIGRRLSRIGASLGDLSAVVVTHEHVDHVRGLSLLSKTYPHVPVFATRGTARAIERGEPRALARPYLRAGLAIDIGHIKVTPIEVAHDAAEPIGLRLDCGDLSLGIATDLGVATVHVQEMLTGCRALVIEANHDPDMLQNGPYPDFLKRRIASCVGHLSNDQAAQLLHEVAGPDLETVVLAHLSQTNNTPDLAIAAINRGIESPEHLDISAAGRHGGVQPRTFPVNLGTTQPPPSRGTASQPRLFE